MADAILNDRKRILPCAANLTGQYGIDGVFVGVPVKLGRNGIEEILEVELSDDDLNALQTSAAHVKETTSALEF